jgi:hypothetical protein
LWPITLRRPEKSPRPAAARENASVTTNASWWVERGWATRGSKLQTQLYVNRQPQALSEKVLEALPELAGREPRLEWVAPLERPRPPRSDERRGGKEG